MNYFTRLAAVPLLAFAFTSTPVFAVELLEDIVHQTYAVDADATIRISNTDGSIRIYAANVTEISVTAIKKSYDASRLAAIQINVEADRHSLVITTGYPPKPAHSTFKDRSGTVEYTLIVPPSVHVTQCDLTNGEILIEGLRDGSAVAHLENGWLAGHNCFGNLDLTLTNGRLDVAYDWWENQRFRVKAESVNGSIRAVVPSDALIKVNATSGSGHVVSALPATGEPLSKPHYTMAPTAAFQLGDANGCELSLQAAHGSVRIDAAY